MSVVIEVETVEIVVENETVLNPIVIEVGDPYIPGGGEDAPFETNLALLYSASKL